MSEGVAMASALAAIPQVEPGKTVSVGAGTGVFNGMGALAIGGSARIGGAGVARVGISMTGSGHTLGNAGVGWSW